MLKLSTLSGFSARRFDPRMLPNLAGWYDPSDASTITIATGVSQWNDKSGNARHLTQGTAANQPARQTAAKNGRDTIRFDGVNDSLSVGAITYGTTSTILAVLKPIVVVGANRDWFTAATGTNANAHIMFYNTADTHVHSYAGSDVDSGFVVTENAWAIATQIINGASSKVRWNLQESTGNAGAQSWSNGLKLGEVAAGGTFHNTEYAEFMVYSRALTSGEILVAERYLRERWAIP